MQISSTPDRLEITVSGSRNLWIGLVIIAVLGLQWWLVPSIGGLSTIVLVIGVAVAGLITLAALGRARIEADRKTGQLTLSRKSSFGGGTETHPLAALSGTEVTSRKSSGSSPTYRCEVVLSTGQHWPLTRAFGAAGPAKAAADAVNAWVAAPRT